MSANLNSDSIQFRDVWNYNLDEEFALIRNIIDDYPYIAMDTEFPGLVLRPFGTFNNICDYNYQTMKDNVDTLKLIQLGLTFSDENGNIPTCGTDKHCVWQFNFNELNDSNRFSELLMSSGLVMNENVKWVSFNGRYDFGYLLKLLTCKNLPENRDGFFELMSVYFPTFYDIKHLMKFCNSICCGMDELAEILDVERIGICGQVGSDSLLISGIFKELKNGFFNGSAKKYSGVLFGLGVQDK